MTFNSGTATDYIDLLDQLIEVLTSRHLSTIAVNAAGTGYVAGDVLGITNTGSTNTHVAQIEVLTIGGGGSISTARVYRGGAYTVDPSTTTGNAATGGTGSGATFDLTFAETGWDLTRRTKVAVSATVGAGGTGYTVGDDVTLVGGVLGNGGVAAVFNVDSVSGGVITALSLVTAGQYEVPPTNAALLSGGTGSGGTANVTYADKTGDTVVVLTGDAGGSNVDPIVAIKTFQGLDESGINATRNWALFGATADSAVVPVHELPNISPGFNSDGSGSITGTATGDGAFMPLKDADAFDIDWWIRATGRNVTVVAKVRGASTIYYPACSFGLLNPFGITTEMPFPAYVLGASDRPKVWYRDTGALFGGIGEMISRANGPGFVWAPEGAWLQFRNASITTNTSLAPSYTTHTTTTPRTGVWPISPMQAHDVPADENWAVATSTGFDNEDLTLSASPTVIYRTPDTGGDLFPLFPQTVVQADTATDFFRTFGEIDGVFWFSTAGVAIASEDRHSQGSEKFKIFQSGTRVEAHSFACLREE